MERLFHFGGFGSLLNEQRVHGLLFVLFFDRLFFGKDGLRGDESGSYRRLCLGFRLVGRFLVLDVSIQAIYLLRLHRSAGFFLLANDSGVGLCIVVESRGDEGHTDGLAKAFVGAVTPDDVGVVATGVLSDFEDLVDFVE